MTLKQLKAFLTIARTLNYANAAKELFLSQSALSLSIKSLEEELGGKLFQRNTRHVELTQDGKALVPYARKLLANWNDMENSVKQRFKLQRGTFIIAAMPFMAHAILPQIIQKFSEKYPNLNFSIHDIPNEKIIENVLDGIYELGICFQPPSHENLVFQPLFHEDFIGLVSKNHVLAQKEQITWQELYAYPFISLQYPSIVRSLLEQNANQLNLILNLKIECHQISSFSQFVALGLGVSAIPRHFKNCIDLENNILVEIKNSKIQYPVGVLYQKNYELSYQSEQFVQTLTEFDFD